MSGAGNKLGHNNGPSMEGGFAFRKHAWTKARADLIPTLPIEILRTRVKRAKALGLPYQTYASVRASTGRDVVGFLFSNNALRTIRDVKDLPAARAARLTTLEGAGLSCLTHPPLDPKALEEHLRKAHEVQVICEYAPNLSAAWSDIRARVQAPLRQANLPLDGVLVIGDTVLEREWSEAGRLAGFVPSDVFFAQA